MQVEVLALGRACTTQTIAHGGETTPVPQVPEELLPLGSFVEASPCAHAVKRCAPQQPHRQQQQQRQHHQTIETIQDNTSKDTTRKNDQGDGSKGDEGDDCDTEKVNCVHGRGQSTTHSFMFTFQRRQLSIM
eukprot:m.33444 g.33444  ORF g.33444 m.33444 type:complete len:132 (-) comp16822_c0_seq1:141-536(-)